MTALTPMIGRIVHYTLSAQDADAINRRRKDASNLRHAHTYDGGTVRTGEQVHVGNSVCEGDVFPMLITRVWGDTPQSPVNGQVFLDGNDTYWVTSAMEGKGPRHYQWPASARLVGNPTVSVALSEHDTALLRSAMIDNFSIAGKPIIDANFVGPAGDCE